MAASKTLPGQKDAKANTSSMAVNHQDRPTLKHDQQKLSSVRHKTAFPTGCTHTKQALDLNFTKTLRIYELAIRVSLEQALSSSKALHSSLHKSSSSSALELRPPGSVSGKTLPGASKYNVSKIKKRSTRGKQKGSSKFSLLCNTCKTFGSTAILCLECSYTGCLTHFKEFHFSKTGHTLGVDMVTGCEGLLFCSACNDYVYDETFENIRLQKIQQILGRSFISEVPAGALKIENIIKKESATILVKNNTASSSEESNDIIPLFPTSTSLRGFYNMGATCFMSVIFQSLIHNPLIRNFYLSGGHERGLRCGNQAAMDTDINIQFNENDVQIKTNGLEKNNNIRRSTKTGITPACGNNSAVDNVRITMNSPSKNCLSCALDDVFAEFFTSTSVAGYGPTNLLTASWRVKQSLAGYSEQDAHEFLQMVLNELHTTHYDSSVLANGASSSLEKIGLKGELPAELRRVEDVNIQNCSCISHRTFCGVLESKITCQVCDTVSSTVHDPVMDISLEIGAPDKKHFKSNGSNSVSEKSLPESSTAITSSNAASTGRSTPAPVTLAQCLDKFTSGETLDATFNCTTCNEPRQIQKRLSIKRLPPVLSIQLKRFLHTGSFTKNEIRVEFPLILDMNKYTCDYENDSSTANKMRKSPLLYELFGVVCHQGSLNTGHYTCMMKSSSGRVSIFLSCLITILLTAFFFFFPLHCFFLKWFHFDDAMVSTISVEDVIKANAYLLFYIVTQVPLN